MKFIRPINLKLSALWDGVINCMNLLFSKAS